MLKAVILVLVAIGAGGWLLYLLVLHPSSPAPVAASVTAPTPAARAAPAATGPSPPAGAAWTAQSAPAPRATATTVPPTAKPLAVIQPDPGTPLRQLETLLRPAADQGDARAACRLGIELARCARLNMDKAMLDSAQQDLARAAGESATRLAQEVQQLTRALVDTQNRCSDVSQDSIRNAWRYVYNAAAAGNVAAMSRFVRDPGFEAGNADDAEASNAYARNAGDFLLRAIEGGDVRALYQAWYSASSGRSRGMLKAFPREPDKALQYGTVAANLVDPRRATLIARSNETIAREIGPARARTALREAEKLRTAYFAHAQPVDWGHENGETDVADCWK